MEKMDIDNRALKAAESMMLLSMSIFSIAQYPC